MANRGVRAAALAAALLGAGVALAPPSAAQQPPCNAIYGCPPPPPPPGSEPAIEIRPPSGPMGMRVGVEACGYDTADAGKAGSITFDGDAVLAVTLDDDGCLVPGTGSNGLPNSFVVPGRPAGDYQVCAVFAGEATPCTTFAVTAGGGEPGPDGDGDVEVLAGETVRGSSATERVEGARVERGRSSGLGSLARTGIGIVGLLALAAVLLLAGRALLLRRRDAGGDGVAR